MNGNAAEKDDNTVKAVASPMLTGVLAGLETGDYALYSGLFDQPMLSALPASGFEGVREQIRSTFGAHTGHVFLGFLVKGATIVTLWKARFSGTADDVLIQLAYAEGPDGPRIGGLWFT